MKMLKYGLAAIVLGAALPQPQARADEGGGPWWGLGGVWQVRLMPRNCTTGDPLPAPSLLTLFTFHDDGTIAGSLQNYAVTGTNRSLSHGVWKQTSPGRPGGYTLKFIHLRYDFATGVFLGTQEAVSELTLGWMGDTFTASSTTRGFDANGNQAYTSCANLSGERVQLP